MMSCRPATPLLDCGLDYVTVTHRSVLQVSSQTLQRVGETGFKFQEASKTQKPNFLISF